MSLSIDDLNTREKQLYSVVTDLINKKQKFRVEARGHSILYHSQIIGGTPMINITKYVTSPTIDTKTNILTVSPGQRLVEVGSYLQKYGLRLYGVPESSDITIGGAVLMGAHGGGSFKCLAEYVTEMWLIDGLGKLQIISDSNLFTKLLILIFL